MSSGFVSGNINEQEEQELNQNQQPDYHHIQSSDLHHHSDTHLQYQDTPTTTNTATSTSVVDMYQQEATFELPPPPYFGPTTVAGGGLPLSSHHDMILPWSNTSSFDHHHQYPQSTIPFATATTTTTVDPSSFLFTPSSSYSPHTNLFSIRPHNIHHAASSSSAAAAAFHHFGRYQDSGGGPSSSDPIRILSDALHGGGQMIPGGQTPFGLQVQAELNKLTAQEIMDAKALAASRSHSEAERRRRERINNHLAKLRSLLPNTTKTDKASLLAEVIQHVKELKRQTSQIATTTTIPTETDDLTIDTELISTTQQDGRMVIKASLCCEDRSDLLPDIIKALKSLRLKTLKAEITTLGGRVKNVLFVTSENDENDPNMMMMRDSCCSSSSTSIGGCGDERQQCTINSIQLALKSVLEKSGDDSASGNAKRQRTNTAATTPTSS